MAGRAALKWRESASLIILSKCKPDATCQQQKAFDYQALLLRRAAKASFMPNAYVFPGGLHEAADHSADWLKYLHNNGLTKQQLDELAVVRTPHRPVDIFTTLDADSLPKDISLRITAIRETFEELGVLLCRPSVPLKVADHYGHVYSDFDRLHWQHVIHNDPAQFLTLCRELQIVPDLWSLYEWSAWLTPSVFSKRFETAFYLVVLQEAPDLLIEQHEVSDFKWLTPYDFLTACIRGELMLPPPQFYELSCLLNFSEMNKLHEFARSRSRNGCTIVLPVFYKCTDGSVALLPGDDMYPSDPHASTVHIPTNMTMAEFRAGAKKLHRSEYVKFNDCVYHLNFPLPFGQLSPANVNSNRKWT